MTNERRWRLAWLGGPLIGIANGATREVAYKDAVGDLTAHQLSTASALGLFAAYFGWLQRRYPLVDDRAALRVGAFWVVLTVLFEFGFGRAVGGKSWRELLADYDLTTGHLWTLVLVWLGLGPVVMRRLGDHVDGPRPAAA